MECLWTGVAIRKNTRHLNLKFERWTSHQYARIGPREGNGLYNVLRVRREVRRRRRHDRKKTSSGWSTRTVVINTLHRPLIGSFKKQAVGYSKRCGWCSYISGKITRRK